MVPDWVSTNGDIKFRFSVLIWLSYAAWLVSAIDLSEKLRYGVVAVVLVVNGGFLVCKLPELISTSRQLKEYYNVAEFTKPNDVMLSFSDANLGILSNGSRVQNRRVEPFKHAGAMLAALTGTINLNAMPLHERNVHYPLRFRPDVDPYKHMTSVYYGMEESPPLVDILRYKRKTGVQIDTITVWGPEVTNWELKLARAAFEGPFEVRRSSPHGWLRMYRPRDSPSRG